MAEGTRTEGTEGTGTREGVWMKKKRWRGQWRSGGEPWNGGYVTAAFFSARSPLACTCATWRMEGVGEDGGRGGRMEEAGDG